MTDLSKDNDVLTRERSLARSLKAVSSPRQFRAVVNAINVCDHPFEFLKRYGTKAGAYPFQVGLKTPTGKTEVTLFSWHDSRTVHEIFLAEDYKINNERSIIVDFGSNIGISAAYFLTRNRESYVYLYETVARNIERLKINMRDFGGRYQLNEVAVGLVDGKVKFGVEDTGRYGGINLDTGRQIEVDCLDSNKILTAIIERHGKIDVLKIDVETMERALVEYLTSDLASKIDLILVEARFETNLLAATHTESVQGTITRYERLIR